MSSRLPFQIHIPRRHHKCMKGEEPLSPGAEYHSILYEDGEEHYRRVDLCHACWEEQDQQALLEDATTHWVSQVSEKPVEDDLVRDRNERALEMLKAGLDHGDPVKNMLLAMMLKRKKYLQYKHELDRGAEGKYHLYEVPATEEMIAVAQVPLDEDALVSIQQQIQQELQ